MKRLLLFFLLALPCAAQTVVVSSVQATGTASVPGVTVQTSVTIPEQTIISKNQRITIPSRTVPVVFTIPSDQIAVALHVPGQLAPINGPWNLSGTMQCSGGTLIGTKLTGMTCTISVAQ